MPDGISKWLPRGTGISDWLASKGQYGLAGQQPPMAPPPRPIDRPEIGEWTFEYYYRLLEDMFIREEEAEFDKGKQASLRDLHDTRLAEAKMLFAQGLWGTADQHRFPQHQSLFSDYSKWAGAVTPEVPEEYPVATKVIPEGDYDFLIGYNEEGKEISRDVLGRTETLKSLGMDDFQKAQVALEQQQLKQQGDFQDAQLRFAELQYAVEMAGQGDEAWINQWYAEQAQRAKSPTPKYDKTGFRNPYTAYLQKYNPDRLRELVEKGFAPREVLTEPLAKFGEPYRKPEEYTYREGPVTAPPAEGQRVIKVSPEGGVEVTSKPPPMGRFGQVQRPEAQQAPPPFQASEFTQRTPTGTGGTRRRGRGQQAISPPPTPKWLPQFAPWLTAGQPIEKGEIPTPSGQLWGKTPPSVQAGLKGFTEWAGGTSYEDMLARMRRMQPQAPRGAGQQRWLPARQR